MPCIHCPKSLLVWLVHRFVVAGSGMTRATISSSRSMYYNPQYTWGLLNEAYESIPKEVAENTQNEDNLCIVL